MINVRGALDATSVRQVTALVEAATEADGVRPLSEHVLLHLRHGGDVLARNVLLTEPGGQLAGYAHLDVTDPVDGPSAEVVVHPAWRRRGHGRALVDAAAAESPDGRLRLWAHGEHPGAAALARSLGFEQVRALWQLRRSLVAALPEASLPARVTVRTFVPGQDELAWLAANRRAFAAHPEQGAWTLEDLRLRMDEPWFDPAGFFLAERPADPAAAPDDGSAGERPADPAAGPSRRIVGFHWTKVHGGHGGHGDAGADGGASSEAESHGHDPIGEVYVLGVDPSAQGSGLGKALTVLGLRHLRARGLTAALLYVEADNAAAIRTYTGLGFTHWDTDLMFRRSLAPALPSPP